MREFQARELLHYTEDQLWQLEASMPPFEPFKLQFDDVIVVTDIRKTTVMWYLWHLHRLYPQIPLLGKHHTAGEHFDGKSVTKLLTRIVDSIREAYGEQNIDWDLLGKQVYETSNLLYNMVATRLGAYVDTVDMRDVVDVYYHPKVVEARDRAITDGSSKAINTLYDDIMGIMSDEAFLPGNSLVETLRIKNSPPKQIMQCIGMLGYRTDIDSSMFPHAIKSSFAEGLSNFNDFIIETRSASKALLFQKDPIRDTEYFNRRMQLVDQVMMHLVPGDCGSTQGLPWEVQPGDLGNMNGKFYFAEGGLKSIDPKSRESARLVGQSIVLRSPLYCKHAEYGAVCETCVGKTSKTIPQGTNMGHVAAYTLGAIITQAVLSVKHLDGSAEIKEISLDATDKRYVRLSTEKSEYIKLQPRLKKHADLTLLLPVDEVANITQAMQAKSISGLSIYRISQLRKVGFKYTVDDMEIIDWVTVSGPSRPSSLSVPFLNYIREHKYHQEDTKFLEVLLDKWDFDLPMFQLPQKQINMLDFMKQLSDMLEGSPKKGVKKKLTPSKPEDVYAYIREVTEYANQHINIPSYCLEITTLAMMARDTDNGDYRLSTADSGRMFATSDAVMQNRSVGGGLAYERQYNLFISANSYNTKNRVAHPIDTLFYPNLVPEYWDKWGLTER